MMAGEHAGIVAAGGSAKIVAVAPPEDDPKKVVMETLMKTYAETDLLVEWDERLTELVLLGKSTLIHTPWYSCTFEYIHLEVVCRLFSISTLILTLTLCLLLWSICMWIGIFSISTLISTLTICSLDANIGLGSRSRSILKIAERLPPRHVTIFSAHFYGTQWTQCHASALLSIIQRQTPQFFRILSGKNPYVLSLSENDRTLLAQQNSLLYTNYVLARYLGAENGLDQLNWILGHRLGKLCKSILKLAVVIARQ